MTDTRRVVIDASALAEYLAWTTTGAWVAESLGDDAELHAPHLVVTEVVSAVRGWARGGGLSTREAQSVLARLEEMPLHLWDARPLTSVVWRLRENATAYDATYVALAQALDLPLVTADRRLARWASAAVRVLAPPEGH